MGLGSIAKQTVNRMEKVDATNPHLLEKWAKRVFKIARNLSESGDIAQQQSFETSIESVAKTFIAPSANLVDTLSDRLRPDVHAERRRILIESDQMLDSFQPSSTEHSQIMQTAALEDQNLLEVQLCGLDSASDSASDEMLKEIRERTTPDAPTHRQTDLRHDPGMSKARKAHARLVRELYRIDNQDITGTALIISVCDMRGSSEIERYLLSLEHTFGDLVEVVLEHDRSAPIPDFWCKRIDRAKNCATESGIWWECQLANKSVIEAIMEGKSSLETRGVDAREKVQIRRVLKDGEYLVALVGKSGVETGVPVDIPRAFRQPAGIHFQDRVFPNDAVTRVLLLDSGADASQIMFDNRSFHHKSNPLFVELAAGGELGRLEE